MLDFSRVQNYYIACGYTDMRKQIDGLVAVVELQFKQKLNETSIFCSAGGGRTGSRHCTGTGQDMCCCISVLQKNASSGHGMSRS